MQCYGGALLFWASARKQAFHTNMAAVVDVIAEYEPLKRIHWKFSIVGRLPYRYPGHTAIRAPVPVARSATLLARRRVALTHRRHVDPSHHPLPAGRQREAKNAMIASIQARKILDKVRL